MTASRIPGTPLQADDLTALLAAQQDQIDDLAQIAAVQQEQIDQLRRAVDELRASHG